MWSSNGTEQGTAKIVGFESVPTNFENPLIVLGDAVYFIGNAADSGQEIWRSDGTANGTSLLFDVAPGSQGSTPRNLTVVGNKIYFQTQRASGVWVTDGTAAGTVSLGLPPSNLFSNAFAAVPGGAIFTWEQPETGTELWFSDGTPQGTRLVKDIWSGKDSSFPSYFRSFQNRVFFSAKTKEDDAELWMSDGTPEGTLQVDSIAPGSKPSYAAPVFATESTLFISADDTKLGSELYVITSQSDLCPNDPQKTLPGACGCGQVDSDRDGDGVMDCKDLCPQDPYKASPGQCGCSTREILQPTGSAPACPNQCSAGQNCACLSTSPEQSQRDRLLCPSDQSDECPFDPSKFTPGVCGCGNPDTDSNLDGKADCLVDGDDECPQDAAKRVPGLCGCGNPDLDLNQNGAVDCKGKADLLAQFDKAIRDLRALKIKRIGKPDKKSLQKINAQLKLVSKSVSAALRDLGSRRKTVAQLKPKKVGTLSQAVRARLKALRKRQKRAEQNALLQSLRAIRKLISVIPEPSFK